jgi:hypothetical protein
MHVAQTFTLKSVGRKKSTEYIKRTGLCLQLQEPHSMNICMRENKLFFKNVVLLLLCIHRTNSMQKKDQHKEASKQFSQLFV